LSLSLSLALSLSLLMSAPCVPVRKFRIGVLVFDGAEDLDFGGPVEVFGSADQSNPDLPAAKQVRFENIVIGFFPSGAATTTYITTIGGVRISPHHTTQEVLARNIPFDVLVIPGGPSVHAEGPGSKPEQGLDHNHELHHWLRQIITPGLNQREKLKLLFTVCSGALLPASAGLFGHLPTATTHHHFLHPLRVFLRTTIGISAEDAEQQAKLADVTDEQKDVTQIQLPHTIPIVQASDNSRYIIHRNVSPVPVIMSGGISAGIDAAFEAVDYLSGSTTISLANRYRMEYYYGLGPSAYYDAIYNGGVNSK